MITARFIFQEMHASRYSIPDVTQNIRPSAGNDLSLASHAAYSSQRRQENRKQVETHSISAYMHIQ